MKWLAGLLFGSGAAGGLYLLTRSIDEGGVVPGTVLDADTTRPITLPVQPGEGSAYTDQDVEAAARMVASENPSAGREVWVEQIWTQIRARKRGQSLYDRITGGTGAWGPQNKRRPVSTSLEAAPIHREVARAVLSGAAPSKLDGARKYFDPSEQDKVFAQVQAGRAALARGEAIKPRTQQLIDLGYKLDADGVRARWGANGGRLVGAIGPVEFWT